MGGSTSNQYQPEMFIVTSRYHGVGTSMSDPKTLVDKKRWKCPRGQAAGLRLEAKPIGFMKQVGVDIPKKMEHLKS